MQDIYNFFLPNIRSYLFPTFELRGDTLKDFKLLKDEEKAKIISRDSVSFFSYNFEDEKKNEIQDENGIFYKVEELEIICFNTGICFLNIKTHLQNTSKFADVLDFNYRFREINSEFASLKEFENIKLKTDSFKDIKAVTDLIQQITGANLKNKRKKKGKTEEKIINSQFYTFSYACVETSNWSEKTNFANIENDFLRFANVLPSNYNSDFNKANLEHNLHVIEKYKYVKTTISNTSSNVLCSGIDIYNYTKLPFEYENQYFYLYILSLYKKLFLMKLGKEFKEYDKIIRLRDSFTKFTKEIWNKEVTLDDTGSLYYKTLNKTLELDDLYTEIKNKYEVIYRDLNIEKNNNYYSIIVILLIFSLIFNTINILFLMYLLS